MQFNKKAWRQNKSFISQTNGRMCSGHRIDKIISIVHQEWDEQEYGFRKLHNGTARWPIRYFKRMKDTQG